MCAIEDYLFLIWIASCNDSWQSVFCDSMPIHGYYWKTICVLYIYYISHFYGAHFLKGKELSWKSFNSIAKQSNVTITVFTAALNENFVFYLLLCIKLSSFYYDVFSKSTQILGAEILKRVVELVESIICLYLTLLCGKKCIFLELYWFNIALSGVFWGVGETALIASHHYRSY